MTVRRTWTVGVVLVAAVACGQQPDPPREDTGPVPAGLERFYAQQPDWGSCDGFASNELDEQALSDPNVECTRLEVPLDHTAPGGRTASIGISRVRTSGSRIGSLVVNPGGPGIPGMSLAVQLAPLIGDAGFDLVGFDPRGVGASTPAVDCGDDEVTEDEMGEVAPPSSVAEAEAAAQELVENCLRLSGGADVLATVGTREVARDLDVLRAVLGDRTLTYLGYSYGTRIGTAYAEAFPGNVRALVLDGAEDPTQAAADELVAQYVAFQAAFDTYAADCARAPDCPLGTDPTRTTAAFQALVRPLLAEPAVAGDGAELTYDDVITAVLSALYDETGWSGLTDGLVELRSGGGAMLLGLAEEYYADGDTDAMLAIDCVDNDRVTDRAAAAAAGDRLYAGAPFADPGFESAAALDACALWPVPPTTTPHRARAEGLPPVLVVSTTGDPATPYADGVALAQQLGARLLTVEGTQHTVALQGDPCVDPLVRAYLVDLTLPADGSRCVAAAGGP